MKVKLLIFLWISCIFLSQSYAQGVLTFTKVNHDFATVAEGTQASYDFEFTNTGKAPVIISNVSASCGCTTPFWTKDPVLPGKKGKITASYNSAGRPGVFNKSITVVSNAEPSTHILTIKGTVVPKEQLAPTSPEQLANSPVIQLDKAVYNFGKIEKGQLVTHKFTITNTGKSKLQIEKLISDCSCVNYTLDKNAIAPGEKAILDIKYTPKSLQQQNEKVTLFSNDLRNPMFQFVLQALVVESLASQNILKEQKTVVPFK
jgi:hypothetical protein